MFARSMYLCGIVSALLVMGACGSRSEYQLKDSIDKKNGIKIALLKVKNRSADGSLINRNLPAEYPLLRVTYPVLGAPGQNEFKKYGMRIDCGADTAGALAAFGYDNDNLDEAFVLTQGSSELNNLGVEQQSVITCDDGAARADNKVFVIPSVNGATAARYFLKFGNDKNPEVTRLYELKCTKNFEFIGGDLKKAIPISEASLKYLYGRGTGSQTSDMTLQPLTCSPGSDPGIYDLPLYTPASIEFSQGHSTQNPIVYKVDNSSQLDSRLGDVGKYYMVVSNGKGYPIQCGSDSKQLLTAMGLKVDPSSPVLAEDSEIVRNANPRLQPVLPCPSEENKLSLFVKILGDSSEATYIRFKQDPYNFLRLGCQGLSDFYRDENLPQFDVPLSALPYLSENPEKTEIFNIACKSDQELAQSIDRIYLEVLNRKPSADVAASIKAALEAGAVKPNDETIANYIVKSIFNDSVDLDRIIGEAFRAAWNRSPQTAETLFIKDWIIQDKSFQSKKLRRHFAELLKHLQSLQNLSLEDFFRSFRDSIGRDPTSEDMAYWHPRLLTETKTLTTYEDSVTSHVAWNQRSNLDKLLPMIVKNEYNWDMNDSDRNQLLAIINSGVRAHYKELMSHLKINPLIPLERFVSITSFGSGKIMQVPSGGGAGTLISQYDNYNFSHQKWKLTDAGNGLYQLHPQHSPGDCLTVWMTDNTVTNNHDVKLGYCSNETRKYWKLVRSGNAFGIQTALADKCLDVFNGSKENSARIAIWGCHYQDHQRWTLR